jgi:hypothetical protein
MQIFFERLSAKFERGSSGPVFRTPVPGGWLVSPLHERGAFCFVPDPEHKWLKEEEEPEDDLKVVGTVPTLGDLATVVRANAGNAPDPSAG